MKWKLYQLCCSLCILICTARLVWLLYGHFQENSIRLVNIFAFSFLVMIIAKCIWAFKLSVGYLEAGRFQSRVNILFYILFVIHAFVITVQLIFLSKTLASTAYFSLRGPLDYRLFFYANFIFIACSVYVLLLDLPLTRNVKKKAKQSLILSITED
jgi:hypothetical protein